MLQSGSDSRYDKSSQLEGKLKETKVDDLIGFLKFQDKLQDTERKYEETCRKIVLIEQDLERAEERAEIAEEKAKALEANMTHLDSTLRSLTVAEEKASLVPLL